MLLQCTEFDPKGNPYGMGQLALEVKKGKRKTTYVESSSPSLLEVQDELKTAQERLAEQDKANERRDRENERLSEELKASQARIALLEKNVVEIMKNRDAAIAQATREPHADNNTP